MKKLLFTLAMMIFGVVSYAQEKPQDAEKRARAVANDEASSEQIIRSAFQSAVKK